jgi:hypothetical protein
MENGNTENTNKMENGNTENTKIKFVVKGLNIHCYNCNDTVCFDKGYCQYKKSN